VGAPRKTLPAPLRVEPADRVRNGFPVFFVLDVVPERVQHSTQWLRTLIRQRYACSVRERHRGIAVETEADCRAAVDRHELRSKQRNNAVRRAEEVAKISRTTLPDAIKGRDLARAAGATNLGKDYTNVEERFIALTEAIEKNNLRYAQRSQARVTEQFRQLELRAIKIQTIGEVRRLIKDAEKKDLQEIAPQSFAVAEQKLIAADAFITQNPYQKEEMHKLAAEALFMARRLHEVAKQSGKVETMDRVERVYSLKMGWCLECHREPPTDLTPEGQATRGPTYCSTCHR